MSYESLGELNWLAVIAGTVAWFVLGAIWYAPFAFGKIWGESIGITADGSQRPNPVMFAANLVAYFVASVATGMIAAQTATDTIAEGVILGLVVGIGYTATLALVGAVYERKPKPVPWFFITSVYNTIGLVIVGVIVAIWD